MIGIYEGKKKTDNANIFLEDFLRDAIELEHAGLTFRGKHITITFSDFICDAPAKAFITCVKSHTGFYGCSKCTRKGVYYRTNPKRKGRVIFPQTRALRRTNLSFRNQTQIQHHKGKSCLIGLAIDMIKAIPLDPMHLLDLGVIRKLLNAWIGSNHPNVKIPAYKINELSKILLSFAPYIPSDFARKSRSLDDLPRWKATELLLFRKYVGPVAFKPILHEDFYLNFLNFHVATRLLSDSELSRDKEVVNYCKTLLTNFVKDSQRLYGRQFVSHNVHNLMHIPEDVLHLGPLESFSAYPFENYMQII